MKLRIALTSSIALALAVLAALGVHASAGNRDVALRATLRGLEEVPPIRTSATATLRASLDESTKKISFTLEYRNLAASPSVAHIHFGPTKVNGGVVAFFCGGGSQPACPTATSGKITGTISPENVVDLSAQGIPARDYDGLVYAIRTGNAYANIHNAKYPSGEARGQIEASGSSRAESQGSSED
jgi:hypothetical protein